MISNREQKVTKTIVKRSIIYNKDTNDYKLKIIKVDDNKVMKNGKVI